MVLPGLLIEYLITGAIALIWVGAAFDLDKSYYDKDHFLIIIPIAYVLGMIIDVIAYWFTRKFKNFLRKRVEKEYARKYNRVYEPLVARTITVKVAKDYKDLANELQMRSSRDRIARGLILNSIGFSFVFWSYDRWYLWLLPLAAIVVWVVFESVSYKFFLKVYDEVKD